MSSTVLEIKDNGKGIDFAKLKDGVRDPFNNLSNEESCLGIGLSKVEAIMKKTNSVFEIENNKDGGTSCRIFFLSLIHI